MSPLPLIPRRDKATPSTDGAANTHYWMDGWMDELMNLLQIMYEYSYLKKLILSDEKQIPNDTEQITLL